MDNIFSMLPQLMSGLGGPDGMPANPQAIQAFNQCLGQFIQSLRATFPEREVSFATIQATIEAGIAIDPAIPCRKFLEKCASKLPQIMSKDPSFFTEGFEVMGLDLAELWRDPALSENSKDAIWSYLQSLLMMASTSSMPPELMALVQSIAGNAAQRIEGGEDIHSVIGSVVNTVLNSSSVNSTLPLPQ